MLLLLLLLLPLPQLRTESLELKNSGHQVQLQELVVVQEGLCVLVPCSFSSPKAGKNDLAATTSLWFRKNESHPKGVVLVATSNNAKKVPIKSSFHLVGDLMDHNCTLSIEAPRREESGIYFLHLNQRHLRSKTQMVLHVTALTQTPTIHIDKALQSGQHSCLRCSLPGACNHEGLLTVSWSGEALESLGLDPNSSEILLMPRPQDHGTQLTCRVTLLGVNVSTERTITLNVSYPPQNLTLSIFWEGHVERRELDHGSSVTVKEGTSLDLVCDAHSNPPPRLSWVWGGRMLTPSQTLGARVLVLRPVEQHHEGKFTCQAEHPRGSLQASLHLSVGTTPKLLAPSCSWESLGLRCSCSAHGRPAPSLHWWLDQELLQENRSSASFQVTSSSQGPWANSTLSLREVFGTSLIVRCEAQNIYGVQHNLVLLLPGQPGLRGGVVLGTVGGAGVAGLLVLCLCFLIFTVKVCKKGSLEKGADRDEAPAPSGRTSWEFQLESFPSGSPDLSVITSGPKEETELHYATLNFQRLRPCTRAEAAARTEYAEIRTCRDQNSAASSKDHTVHRSG